MTRPVHLRKIFLLVIKLDVVDGQKHLILLLHLKRQIIAKKLFAIDGHLNFSQKKKCLKPKEIYIIIIILMRL